MADKGTYAVLAMESYKNDLIKQKLIPDASKYEDSPVSNYSVLMLSNPEDFKQSGFYAAAFIDPSHSTVIISFRGTDNLKDWSTDAFDVVPGAHSAQYDQAEKFYEQVKKDVQNKYPKAHISFTGHSLGGAIAQYMSLKTGLHSVTFNAPGLTGVFSETDSTLENMLDTGMLIETHSPDEVEEALYEQREILASQQIHKFDSLIQNYVWPGDVVSQSGVLLGSTYVVEPVNGPEIALNPENAHGIANFAYAFSPQNISNYKVMPLRDFLDYGFGYQMAEYLANPVDYVIEHTESGRKGLKVIQNLEQNAIQAMHKVGNVAEQVLAKSLPTILSTLADPVIMITPEEVHNAGANFLQASKESQELIHGLVVQMQMLQDRWEGVTSHSFYQAFQEAQQRFIQASGIMDDIGRKLCEVANRFRQVDELAITD